MQEICSSNPPVVNGICDSNKSRAQHHHMFIVPVKIRYMNKRREVTTYAILDNCSQGTFVREDIIHKLEASGTRTKITVKTMNGGLTHVSTAADGLENASSNKSINKQWIKLPKSYTTSDLPIDAKEVRTKEKLWKWKYFDNISKKTCQDDNIKIGILIGPNCLMAIEPIEVIPSQEGGPYAF